MIPFWVGVALGFAAGASLTFWAAYSFIRDVVPPEKLKKYFDERKP